MDQEVDIQRLEQLEKYTFLEFAVSPKLFREYIQLLVSGGNTEKIISIAHGHYQHLLSVLQLRLQDNPNEAFEDSLKIKKVSSLFKLIMICLSNIELTAKLLAELMWDHKLVTYAIERLIQADRQWNTKIKLQTIRFALELLHVIHSENPNDVFMFTSDLTELNTNNGPSSLVYCDALYLLIQYYFLRDEYEQVRQIIESTEILSLNQLLFNPKMYYFDAEKLKLIRQLIDANVYTPVTDMGSDQEATPKRTMFREEGKKDKKEKKGQPFNIDLSMLQMSNEKLSILANTQPGMIIDYLNYLLDDSVRFFNKDSFNTFKASLPFVMKGPDGFMLDYIGKLNVDPSMDPRQLMPIFEQPVVVSFEQLHQPYAFKILVSLLIDRSEQIRVRIEKDKLNLDLFGYGWVQQRILIEAVKVINANTFDLGVLTNSCALRRCTTSRELTGWVVSIQTMLYVLFGQLHLAHHNALKNKGQDQKEHIALARDVLKNLRVLFEMLHQEDMLDLIRDFIEGICVRYYLDTIQAVLMKEENQAEPINFNTVLTFLNQYFLEYFLPCKLKHYFLTLSFQREKQLISITIRQFHLPIDQMEIKYSKLYKKQIPSYFKQKKYLKSISQTLKYFLGYQSPVHVYKRGFLAEQQIITLMYRNFDELRGDVTASSVRPFMACLILSQFIDNRSAIETSLADIQQKEIIDILKEESEFLFDPNLIQSLGKQLKQSNASNSMLSYLITRMTDGDCFTGNDMELKTNIKEKYFKRYLEYMREQCLRQ